MLFAGVGALRHRPTRLFNRFTDNFANLQVGLVSFVFALYALAPELGIGLRCAEDVRC